MRVFYLSSDQEFNQIEGSHMMSSPTFPSPGAGDTCPLEASQAPVDALLCTWVGISAHGLIDCTCKVAVDEKTVNLGGDCDEVVVSAAI